VYVNDAYDHILKSTENISYTVNNVLFSTLDVTYAASSISRLMYKLISFAGQSQRTINT